jgi:ABC-type nitrate/sulfonate/bicarbonate transport system substrate-binding protein
MKKIIIVLIIGLIIICGLTWFFFFRDQTTPGYNGPTQEVTLKLKWQHQAQFAGNYVALEQGFYKQEGLKVNLIPFNVNDSSAIDDVANGIADFGIAGADEILFARERGLAIKAIAVIYKINPVAAYSLKERGIVRPTDFIGKTVGIEKGTNVEYLYNVMMKKLNIDRNSIKEVGIGYEAKEVLSGSVDVGTGYIINEPNLVTEKGQAVNIILVADYGANMYADVLFTTDNLIKTDPDLVGRFLSATLSGWQYAIENKKEAIDAVLKYATSSTRIHQEAMLDSSIPLITTGTSPLGWMESNQWKQAVNILLEEELLSESIDVSEAFTTQFVSDYYLNLKK